MRYRTIVIVGIATLFVWSQDAYAQRRSDGGRSHLGTFRTNRHTSRSTRAQNVLRQSPLERENSTSLLDQPRPSRVRTRYLLNARNMLSARSVLGRNATSLIGRSTLFVGDLDELFPILPATSRPTSQTAGAADADLISPSTYEDALEDRLDRIARERFELGAAYAREGDFLRADHAFDAVKQLDYDNPRPYVASMYVAFKQRNTNTAIVQMVLALDRAETMEDLRIDGFVDLLYEGETPQEREQAFRSTLEVLNMTTAVSEASPLNVVLAYFAWVDGDLDLAVQAADTATKAFEAKYEDKLTKFRDLLAAERQASQSPVETEEREKPTQGESGSLTAS